MLSSCIRRRWPDHALIGLPTMMLLSADPFLVQELATDASVPSGKPHRRWVRCTGRVQDLLRGREQRELGERLRAPARRWEELKP